MPGTSTSGTRSPRKTSAARWTGSAPGRRRAAEVKPSAVAIPDRGTSPGTCRSERGVIETTGLRKLYGKKPALVDLDLSVREGEVFGFIGPNGAGKTTIRLLLDLIRPTRGSARVLGLDPL